MQYDCSGEEYGRTEQEEKRRLKEKGSSLNIDYSDAGVIITPDVTAAELKGFEYYLTDVQFLKIFLPLIFCG
mgnify:CR=1 FL=1